MVGHILWTEGSVQIHAKIEFMMAGHLLTVLDMSPSTMNKGPSTMIQGDTFRVTPSTYTLLWGLVSTLNRNNTRHTQMHQMILTPFGDVKGCQYHLVTLFILLTCQSSSPTGGTHCNQHSALTIHDYMCTQRAIA